MFLDLVSEHRQSALFQIYFKDRIRDREEVGTGRQGERQKQCVTNQIFVDCLDTDLNVHH